MCENCIDIKEIYSDFIQWIKNNPVEISIVFFLIIFVITCCTLNISTLSALAASAGLIFVALKYKLDQASYHKALFEERYKIFKTIEKVFWDSFHENDSNWQKRIEKLDTIYRKSYFLFNLKTHQFIMNFRKAIIDKHFPNQHTKDNRLMENKSKAEEFLNNLLDGQKLSEKFPELKIDAY